MNALPRLVRSIGVVALLPAVAFCAQPSQGNSTTARTAIGAVGKGIVAVVSDQLKGYKQVVTAAESAPILLFAEDDGPGAPADKGPAPQARARMMAMMSSLLPPGAGEKLKLSDEQKGENLRSAGRISKSPRKDDGQHARGYGEESR